MRSMKNKIIFVTVFLLSIFCISYHDVYGNILLNNKDKIPAFEISDEENNTYNVKQFEGQLVIIYFWASWCLECIDVLIQLDKLKEKLLYENINNVEIIPISIDSKNIYNIEKIYSDSNIRKLGLFFDSHKAAMKVLGVNSIPTSIILNSERKEITRNNYSIKWNIQENIQSIIAKSKEYKE